MRQHVRFKKHFRVSLALHVVVLLFSHFSFAQTYPVSATLQLTPPYSVYLSDYTVNDQMKLHLLLRDLSEPSYQVRLSLVLEGVGIRIETNPNSVPPPITIEGGIPSVLSAEDLAPYLDTRNLIFSGISRQEYEQRAALPEGFYRFCFRVYDYKRKDVLLSQEACAQAWFMLNDPPRINAPLCGSTLPVRDPQNILFQWLPMNANSPNSALTTEYEFTLVEIRPPGRNPNDAINVGYPIFQTTTQQTSLIYGLLEPPLIPGQEYAFRVRAIDTEGRDQFKNRGYSEVCTFKFGDSAVPPPEGMNVYVEGERRAKVTWYTTLETDRYRVEYRKKSTGTGYTWFTIETTQDNALIQDLEPDTEYEVRVVGILKNQIGSYSPTKNFRTTPPRVYSCGQSVASMTPLNTNPLRNAMVGQIWKLDLFDMIVLDVSGSNGTFSGFGGVLVPFLGVKLYCQFENIKINEKQELIAGEVLSVKGDIEALKKRLVDINEQKKKDKAKSSGYVFEGVDIKFEGTIDSLYVNDAGEVIAVVASNENSTNGSIKKEERKIDTKKGADNRITDDSGNVYVVSKDGAIEKMGSTGASGTTAVASNVNYRVDFESSSNQAYGFDQQQYSEHERNYEKYERDGKIYTIPWKSVASGSRDVVIAKSTESRKDFLKEVIYKTDNGLLLRKPGNQENEVQLTVEGFGDQSTEQVTAYYKRKDADGKEKEVIAGKLNVVSYDKLVERLVIVSVNNTALNSSTTELAESLNTIFAPAAVEWTVESQSIDGINYDTNGKSGLDDGSTGIFSNYTGEMRTVINAYKDKYDIAKNTWYLFLVPNSESGRTQGFMPRKKQAGFIFMEQLGEASLAKVIAHEIGHGAFRLEHTFDTYNTLAKSSTDNLMDYQPNGITLHKYQWDLIHDPAAVLGLFEGDEGGALYYDNTRMITFLKTIRENNGKYARISDPGKDAYLTNKTITEKDLKDQKVIDLMSSLSIYRFREPKDEVINGFILLINKNKGDAWSKLIEARTTPQPHDENPILLARMMNVEVDTKEKFTLSMNGYSLSEKSITLYAKESAEGNDVKFTFFNALSATPGVVNPEPKTSTINIRKAFDITVHSNNANAFKEYIKLRGGINMIDEDPESEEIIIDVVRKRSNQFITIDELSIRGTNIRGGALELAKGTEAESKATCTMQKANCYECKRILPGEFNFEITNSGGQGHHVYKTIRLLNTKVNGSQRDGILIHMGDDISWTQGCILAMYDNEIEEIIKADRNISSWRMGYGANIDERNASRAFILSLIEFIEEKEKRIGKNLTKKVVIKDDTNEQALTVSTVDFDLMQKANRYYYINKIYDKAVEQFELFANRLQEKVIQDKLQTKLDEYTEKLIPTLTKDNYKESEVKAMYEAKLSELYSTYAGELTLEALQIKVKENMKEFREALKANFEIFIEKDILMALFDDRLATLLHKNVIKSSNLKEDGEVFKKFYTKNLTISFYTNAMANLKSKMIETEMAKITKAINK